MIAGQETSSDKSTLLSDPRLNTFQSYLKQLKLYDPNLIKIGSFSSEAGYKIMKKFIIELGDKLPPAFFAAMMPWPQAPCVLCKKLKSLSQKELA